MMGSGGLPALSVRRPMLATVMNVMIVLAGIAALFGVEIRELPDVDRPVVSVRASYPGASPTTIDAEATSVVESAVARVSGVLTVESASEQGNFRVRAEFRPNVDLAVAANDVREAVSRVTPRLPDGVEDLYVVKAEQDAWPVMRVAVWSADAPLHTLTTRIEDAVIPELTAIDGVAEVTTFGERERVIRIAISPTRLAAYGLSIGEVTDVLRAARFDVPVGSMAAGEVEVLVRADATVSDPARIAELMVRDPVRLGDVADVYFGLATPESIARLNGRLVLSLGIVRQAQSNTVAISDGVHGVIRQLETRFPELRFQVTSDDAVFIRGSIDEVLMTMGMALAIVVLVLWLFLGRLSVTLMPAIAIPVSLIGSVAAIWLLGFSINLITLLALVLAIGLVVDDAIVVTENIQRRRAEGMGAMAAAVLGTRQVFFAVVATTITLIAVFVPISFMPGDAGRLFAEFGFVLAITLAISAFVALSLCPMIASRLPSMGGSAMAARVGSRVIRGYAALLRVLLAAPLVSVTGAAIIGASAFLVYGQLGEELVPAEDRGSITVYVQGPDGTGLDYTDRQVEKVEEMLWPLVASGKAEGLYSVTGRWDLNRGVIGARLIPWHERDFSQGEIEARLAPELARLPGARARISSGNSLGLWGADGRMDIALTGPDYPTIAEAAFAFAEKVETLPGLGDVRVEYQATQPQLSIRIDRGRAADLGVSMSALSATLRALIDEVEIAELTIDDQAVPIMVQSRVGAVLNPGDLLNLKVRAESGALVPLSQLVDFTEEGVAAELDRHAQRRAVEISVALDPGVTLRDGVERVRALGQETLPGNISLLMLDEAAALDETSAALTATYVMALVIVFLVLLAQFESLTSAAIIMITVPFGVSAAVFALWLTGTTINVFSQIGVLMLIGIMAKNGILLVEFADQLRDRGMTVRDAAMEAACVRLRPISMTMVTAILTGLPLVLSGGPGAEARAAIGWVIFGGLGLATAFTLFLAPATYALIAGLSPARASAGQELDAQLARAWRESAEGMHAVGEDGETRPHGGKGIAAE